VDGVHEQWTLAGSHSPPGTNDSVDRRAPWRDNMLARAWPPATPEHGSSPARAQKREGSAGNPSLASPKLRRWCRSRATVKKRQRRGTSVVVVLELRGMGKMGGGEVRCMVVGVTSFYRGDKAVRRGGGR
jgi:hypothetical protein